MEENNHMKATGIVRRIDDLGRVVVPKEIRRTLRIREGDPLEIFTDREGEIILKKYSLIGELSQYAGLCAEALAQTTGQLVCITDRDHVVAAVGAGKRDFEGKPISKQLEGFMEGRGSMVATAADEDFVQITLDDSREHGNEVVSTILCEGDAVGAVVLYGRDEKNKFGDTEQKLAMTAATFLGRQMEQQKMSAKIRQQARDLWRGSEYLPPCREEADRSHAPYAGSLPDLRWLLSGRKQAGCRRRRRSGNRKTGL